MAKKHQPQIANFLNAIIKLQLKLNCLGFYMRY